MTISSTHLQLAMSCISKRLAIMHDRLRADEHKHHTSPLVRTIVPPVIATALNADV